LTVRSIDSGRPLFSASHEVRVTGTFGDFDRGWQFLGPLYPLNGGENWRQIVKKLLPAAQAEVGAALSKELDSGFRERMALDDVREELSKTLALVVGVSHYQDTTTLPPLPYAASDAAAVAGALLERGGLEERHVLRLLGSEATRAGLEAAVRRLTTRTREGDRLVVYFSGYGTRDGDGRAVLLLHDAGQNGESRLSLADLAAWLGEVEANKLLVLDCGFDGQGRSVASGEPGLEAELDGIASAAGAVVVSASGPRDDLLAPEPLESGLFSHHLVAGLRGAADRDEDGRVTVGELFSLAREHTQAYAARFGKQQRPRAAGLERDFVLFRPPPAVEAKDAP
jgi:hypothetical protein